MMPHTRRGFTIVELLVVVSIIVVLLALLSPAIDRAMAEAEVVMCATRKHQMMAGTSMYQLDHKLYFFSSPSPWAAPDSVGEAPETPVVSPWATSGRTRGYNNEPGGDWYDLVRPYIVTGAPVQTNKEQPSQVFFCQTVFSTKNYFGDPLRNHERSWTDMAINTFLTGRATDPFGFRAGPVKATNVTPPNRVIVYMESIRGYNPNWAMYDYFYVLVQPPYQDVLKVHEGVSNMTFADGHIERADPQDVGYEDSDLNLARSKPYQLLHAPDTGANGR